MVRLINTNLAINNTIAIEYIIIADVRYCGIETQTTNNVKHMILNRLAAILNNNRSCGILNSLNAKIKPKIVATKTYRANKCEQT